jgi:2-methylcitrate dehydratase PrpD
LYLTERFAKLAVGTDYASIPGDAIEKAKQCMLDCMGVAIAGSAEPIRAAVMQYLEAVGGHAHATLIGAGGSYSEGYFPAKGATDNPLTRDELVAKFNECAQWGGVSPDKAARAVDLLLGLDRVTSPDELMRCVVR